MKKILSVLLSLTLVLCAVSALAGTQTPLQYPTDTIGGYRVATVAPEGYTAQSGSTADGGLFISVSAADDSKAEYAIVIRHSEMYDGLTINELSEEEKAELIGLFTADYAAPEISYGETRFGTELVIVDENGSASDYVDMLSLYQGYLVNMNIFRVDGETVTEADIELGKTILSDMTFESVE